MLRKTVTIILAIMMLFTASISAFEGNKVDQEPLRGEYFRTFYLDREELDNLEDLMYKYHDSIFRRRPDMLLDLAKDTVFETLAVKFLGGSIGTIVSGLKTLLDILEHVEYNNLIDYSWDGYSAVRRARNAYLSSENSINSKVYGAEIEFRVYTRWDRYNQEFISGGGNIKRVKVDGGWISTGSPYFLKLLKKKRSKMYEY